MAVNGIRGKALYCALALFILAFALPAAKEDLQGWQCAWIVLSALFTEDFSELPLFLWLNIANLGTLAGWWFWRAGSIGRATVSFALATSSAAWWPLFSDFGPEGLKAGYWCWVGSMALFFLLGLRTWQCGRGVSP